MYDLGAQLTASGNQLYAGFSWGRKTGELGEKPSKQRREPTQTQATYGVGSRRSEVKWSEVRYNLQEPTKQRNYSLTLPWPPTGVILDTFVTSNVNEPLAYFPPV